ncbi:MAG: BlaI/MecI/CopY family transcriptional regulator [Longimicrobiales bacterium]
MTNRGPAQDLSRRERQIMDVIWRRGRATVAEVRREMPEAPSYSAVRTLLGLLEQKGHLRHEQDGPRYVYLPTADREKVQRNALRHMVRTFFDGSAERAVAALLDLSDSKLSTRQLNRLARLLEQARSQGR